MRSKSDFVKLRGHHIICLHFFKGRGYSLEFIKNLAGIVERAETGAKVVISRGPDEVCKMCPYLEGDKCDYGRDADEEIREMDETALKLLGLKSGDKVTWPDIRKKLRHVLPEWSGKYCRDCDWRWACEKAEGQF
jgi:hypothetical protein